MTFDTQTPIFLITGGSRGLGRAMALGLADKGADVVLTYHARKEDAAGVVSEIEAKGRTAAALQLDTGDMASFTRFETQLGQTLGETWGTDTITGLVNNAGIGINTPIAETSEAQFDQLMNMHLKGVYFLTQTLLPRIADNGRILNISSGLARFSYAGFSAYAMMKGGIEVFTRYLALELGSRGISVNTIAPGAIETDFGGGLVRDNEEMNAAIAGNTPLGRVGLPEDIGGAVAAMLTSDTRWINGERIEVSGGIHH
ncbi:SDR family NAD(P)-dependent oxidoreductase [Henriciella aquimarina]|uniref:SDR family NAD(P)-dependent oxidoreductase n=1 Tax=Henriciella aquimarina TaxID=545261 RepID=UPI000A040AF1|nr:SDR family oxidoreductase [Henriciella aquimarina]